MIGQFGLMMHMAGALATGLGVGWYRGAKDAGRGIKKRAQERFLGRYWDEIMESEAEYKKRQNRLHESALRTIEQMRGGSL